MGLLQFGIEFLNKTEQSSTKSICFEALNMHDRKLWILKLKDAIGKYQEKSDQEKAKKYSGTKFTSTRLKRTSIYKRERLIEIMDKQNQVTRRTFQ